LLVLINIQYSTDTKHTQIAFRKAGAQIRPVAHKIAVVGLTPVKRILLNAVVRATNIRARGFSDPTSAKNWLIDFFAK